VRVLVLGGTGSIGTPVLRALVMRGHEVIALARSNAASEKVTKLGAQPLSGDIERPHEWLGALPPLGGVIHAASDFSDRVAAIDRALLEALLPLLEKQSRKTRFIYTGGCWLFGETGNAVATEATALKPLAADAWWRGHLQRILDASGIEPVVVHPAMVYEAAGGVFGGFARDAIAGRPIRVVASEDVRWPLVHADDLATLYALALESGRPRESYIGSAIDGLRVGRIAQAFAQRFAVVDRGIRIVTLDQIAAELGEWARGFGLDQQLSGAKARRSLGWAPQHRDAQGDIAAIVWGLLPCVPPLPCSRE